MTTGPTTEPQATDPATPPETPPTPAPEPDPETLKLANEQVRSWANGLNDENKELRKLAMETALDKIGLKPEEGLGLAIVETFKGTISHQAIADYAESKYKHSTGKQTVTDPAVTAADQIEQLNAEGQSVTPTPQPTPGEEAAHKVDSGDPEVDRSTAINSVAAKMGQFVDEHYGNR